MSASSVPGMKTSLAGARSDAQPMTAWDVLKMAGSLKITVVMFFLAIWLVLFGTLAQDEQNLRDVKEEYFNSFVAIVPLDVLLPITIFPHDTPIPGAFPFPGGATIGLILMFNLIAAKLTRFHVSAKGGRLVAGTLLSLLGAGLVVLVIVAGNQTDGLQGKPPIEYSQLWTLLRWSIVALTIGSIAAALFPRNLPSLARITLWVVASLMVALSVFLLASGERVRLDDPGLRIVWQLLQSSVAAMVVLAGLWMVFGNRGGNVLIHVGVALLMLGQFIFGDRQVEQRMSLLEGQETNLVYSQDEVELALVDISDPAEDDVVAIPESRLVRAADYNRPIDDPALPVKVKVLKWMPNSTMVKIDDPSKNLATAGNGLQMQAVEERTSGGAMSKVNIASAYIELIDKKSDQSLGVYLVSQFVNDQKQLFMGAPDDRNDMVTIDGKPYEIGLRFRREYKPYFVFLKDVERKDYEVSDRARDFSSHVVIKDPRNDNSEFNGHIWMNNPVRYRNESFYQSEYNAMRGNDGRQIEMTGLQVVANQGWVIPYVSCMLVLFGMISHFTGVFLRFSNRFERGAIPTAQKLAAENPYQANSKLADNKLDQAQALSSVSTGRMLTVVLGSMAIVGLTVLYAAMPPRYKDNQTDWYAIGKIPVMHEGRAKPLDTVARNVLQVLYEPLFGSTPRPKDSSGERNSATNWLLAVMADKEWAADSPVFRVYAQEARDYFDLKPRPGFLYSYNQLKDKSDQLGQELQTKRDNNGKLSREDERLAHIQRKLQLYDIISISYRMPPLPNENQFEDTEEGRNRFASQLRNLMEFERRLEQANPPAIIPPQPTKEGEQALDERWQAFSPAFFTSYLALKLGMRNEPNPAIEKFSVILDAYRANDAKALNQATSDYLAYVHELPSVDRKFSAVPTEVWLNHFNPTVWGVLFYIIAAIVALSGIMATSPTMRWATFGLILATFAVHTIAIVVRIWISGRPPVVNLYSSAVFIGWAAVLGSMILELIYPLGVCNLAAALIGASTLSIARSLDTSDTMHVLEAVLDTQFWLSTHVITIALGYSATFLAGFFGVMALIHRMRSGIDGQLLEKQSAYDRDLQQIYTRIIYGILCFAILLSFIGTVLGGLWADDSWGRFWGWDPKENGALMIVLWNALVLHANWDRMVGPRGLAVLAVLGNIVTSWSWFGTNQLGIGLHSYGFTSTVLFTLAGVVICHLAFVGLALLVTGLNRAQLAKV